VTGVISCFVLIQFAEVVNRRDPGKAIRCCYTFLDLSSIMATPKYSSFATDGNAS